MVKSMENVAPFLLKCYEMVEDESTDSLISWAQSHNSFIIWDVPKFSSQLLPKYFKHNNFSSFIRQLNIYGFHKSDTDRWEFASDSFLKGQKHLLKNIVRRKNSSVVQKKSLQSEEAKSCRTEDNKSLELWKEVEELKIDKDVLTQELVKLRQHQQNSESKLILLREQLKGMETHQQQMLSFIVMAMQSPGFLVQFFQPKENNWRKTENGSNILNEIEDDSEGVPSERAIVRYLPTTDEAVEPLCAEPEPPLATHKSMELDLSSEEIKDLFSNMDFFSKLMDEKRLSFENTVPLTLPDFPGDDDMLEQLLLSSPIPEDEEGEGMDHDSSRPTGVKAVESGTFISSDELFRGIEDKGMGTALLETQLDSSSSMDVLTEKMVLTKF